MKDNRVMDGTKALWHMDRLIAHYDKGERIAPVHIDMGIAKFCNIDCVFCYGQFQQMQHKFIQREPLIQTMKDAGEIGVRSIAVVGDGEPTCNPNFYDALYAGKEAGVSLATSTNGLLLNTDKRLEAILDNCDWMRFCIAAGDREGYLKVHQKDVFVDVVENISRMVKLRDKRGYNCDVGMQAVFVPGVMEEDMVKESELAVKLGVDYFVIKQCSLPERNMKVGKVKFNPQNYGKQETIDALNRCEDKSTDRTKVIVKWNVMAQAGVRDYKGCPSIPLISEMSGNGDWYPCGFMFGDKPEFKDFKFGNVHDMRLKDIFESDRYWDIVEKMKAYNVQKDCAGCCRQDQVNRFVDGYLNKPSGRNFI